MLEGGTWLIGLKICDTPLLSRMSCKDPLCRSEISHTSPDYWCSSICDRGLCALPMALMLERHCADQLVGFIRKASQIPFHASTTPIMTFIIVLEWILLTLILVSIMVTYLAKTWYL